MTLRATTPWGWSQTVLLVTNPTEAAQIIGLLTLIRATLATPLDWWQAIDALLPTLSDAELQATVGERGDARQAAGALLRSLVPIALNPMARADALLSLDVHMAYLRAQFGVTDP